MQNSSLEFDYIGFGTSYDLGMGIGFTFLSVIGESTYYIYNQSEFSFGSIFQVDLVIF